MADGRAALNVIRVTGPQDAGRLSDAALAWLPRIAGAGDVARQYETVVFVPVGAGHPVLSALVVAAQRELRSAAILSGHMIGDFLPGHEGPGLHNPSFRPLDSPWPLLGIRTMVEADILFLGSPDIPPADRRAFTDAWQGFFAGRASRRFASAYERCRDELDRAEPQAPSRDPKGGQ